MTGSLMSLGGKISVTFLLSEDPTPMDQSRIHKHG